MASKLQRFRENMNSVENDQEQLDLEMKVDLGRYLWSLLLYCVFSKIYCSICKGLQDDFNMLNLKSLSAPDLSSCEKI